LFGRRFCALSVITLILFNADDGNALAGNGLVLDFRCLGYRYHLFNQPEKRGVKALEENTGGEERNFGLLVVLRDRYHYPPTYSLLMEAACVLLLLESKLDTTRLETVLRMLVVSSGEMGTSSAPASCGMMLSSTLVTASMSPIPLDWVSWVSSSSWVALASSGRSL